MKPPFLDSLPDWISCVQLTLVFLKSWLVFFWNPLLNMWVGSWSLVFSWVGNGFCESLERSYRSSLHKSIVPLRNSDKFQSPPNILRSIARRCIKYAKTVAIIFRNFVGIKQKIHLLHTVELQRWHPFCQPEALCHDSGLNFILHYPLGGGHILHKPTQQS